jgi:hypothetical protein
MTKTLTARALLDRVTASRSTIENAVLDLRALADDLPERSDRGDACVLVGLRGVLMEAAQQIDSAARVYLTANRLTAEELREGNPQLPLAALEDLA